MNDGGILGVLNQEEAAFKNPSRGFLMNKLDFVQIFPHELCSKLFSYLSEKDLLTCARCSLTWHQVINDNVQWKLRCIRRGWASTNSCANLVQKWNKIPSHVCMDSQAYKFRTSPNFSLSNEAAATKISLNSSGRIPPPCAWRIYFQQCLHVLRNWNKGIYVIHRLADLNNCPDYEYAILNNDFDCNGKLLVVGTSSGKVLLWSVDGVPRFLTSISLRGRRMEVESVILKAHFLIVLYQSGLIKVFDTSKLHAKRDNNPNHHETELELVYAIRGIGKHSNDGNEFLINALLIQEEDDVEGGYILEKGDEYYKNNADDDDDDDDEDDEIWIRDLFRIELWGNDEMDDGDMAIYANEAIAVLTGVGCRCFHWWRLDKGSSADDGALIIRQVWLPPGYHVIYQCYLSPRKLYLSTKKYDDYGNMNQSPSFVLVYDLASLEETTKKEENPLSPNFLQTIIHPQFAIPAETMVEEIKSDSFDKRIAFATQDGEVCGVRLENNEFKSLFNISTTPSAFVDNLTVSDTLIVYHQYDGFLIGINWIGEQLYEIEAHYGLVKGLQIFEDRLLVSGGNAMQLCVWDAKTGQRLHTVFHQPCRIQQLYLDATKIITVGREDPPVIVGYW